MADNGKGGKSRPISVPLSVFKDNYERTFIKKEESIVVEIPDDIRLEIERIKNSIDRHNETILRKEDRED